MPKNIVILSDGTGNSAASLAKTNVWRLYRALDLAVPAVAGGTAQVAVYRDGVGTSSFRPLALLGGIFGLGLGRNIVDLYKFLCRTYEPGDQIYAFGFSRGAFTVRVLVAFVLNQGVLKCGSEEALDRYANDAYRAYRRRYKLPAWGTKVDYENSDVVQGETVGWVDRIRNGRDAVIRLWRRCMGTPQYDSIPHVEVETIRFLGVWDTVAAYGLPLDELTRGVDEWVWPLSMPNYTLSAKVLCARHALALDEERDSFRPLLWDEGPEAELEEVGKTAKDRLKQVWFAGVHANVGGGYPDDTLSYVPLEWMMEEARQAGLRFNDRALCEAYPPPNPFGRMYDSRAGIGAYYRYQPRRISSVLLRPKSDTLILRDPRRGRRGFLRRAIIHDSVLERIQYGRDHYAPVSITDRFSVEAAGPGAGATARPARSQERSWQILWNDVWRRRVNYFATVGASLALLIFPLWQSVWPPTACVGPQCALAGPIQFAGGLLPGFASPWIEAFAAAPATFAVAVLAIWLLMRRGQWLKQRIRDDAREIWFPEPRQERGAMDRMITRLRSSRVYQKVIQRIKWVLAPSVFGIAVLAVPILGGLASLYIAGQRTALVLAERSGKICSQGRQTGEPAAGASVTAHFTEELCWRTATNVTAGERYRVTLTVTSEWWDGDLPASPLGFTNDRLPWTLRWAPLVRRSMGDRWFQPILRIETPGGPPHLQALEFSCACGSGAERGTYVADFTAPASGRVSLFVNDVALGAFGIDPQRYANNRGSADLAISPLAPAKGPGGP
ncbi:MAG: hypothetical protein JWQ36_2882 [Enterovirga sp.]|nr:hypothetical protein [Enterovirga sp.]